MAKLTDEEKKVMQDVLQQMKNDFNGCPLFEGREKGSLDDLTDKELHIEDIYPLEDYHCVVFEEIPDYYFLTGGALKDMCNKYEKLFVVGRCISIQPMVKTKGRRDFRPIRVLG